MLDEELIQEVQNHAVIYNRQKYFLNSTNPGKYLSKEDAWEDIALKLYTDVDTCKKRWKYLRERYVQQRKQGDPPNYEHLSRPYLEKMKFLDKHIQPRKSYKHVTNFLSSPNANGTFPEFMDSSRSNGSLNNNAGNYNNYHNNFIKEEPPSSSSFQNFKTDLSHCSPHHSNSHQNSSSSQQQQHHQQQQSRYRNPHHNQQQSIKEFRLQSDSDSPKNQQQNSNSTAIPSTCNNTSTDFRDSSGDSSSIKTPIASPIVNIHEYNNDSPHSKKPRFDSVINRSNKSNNNNVNSNNNVNNNNNGNNHHHDTGINNDNDDDSSHDENGNNNDDDEQEQIQPQNDDSNNLLTNFANNFHHFNGRLAAAATNHSADLFAMYQQQFSQQHNHHQHLQQHQQHQLNNHQQQQQPMTNSSLKCSEQLLGELVTSELLRMNKEKRKIAQRRILEVLFFDD